MVVRLQHTTLELHWIPVAERISTNGVHKSLIGHTRTISRTYWHQMSTFLHCVRSDLVVPRTRRRIADRTASMEQVADRPQAADIGRLISALTENISIWVCLRAPKNKLICFVIGRRPTCGEGEGRGAIYTSQLLLLLVLTVLEISHIIPSSNKLLSYCLVRQTQPPTSSGTWNEYQLTE